jgi:para-aminobenzoate synthetase component 1
MCRNDARDRINGLGSENRPFVFFTDFTGENTFIAPLDALDASQLWYDFNGVSNVPTQAPPLGVTMVSCDPVSKEAFAKAFHQVVAEINYGNSFLTNLTFPTPIVLEGGGLKEVFLQAKARYKVCFEDRFICFSPETFISIRDGYIYSHPMKGTIRADIPNAEALILRDPKEMAEHITIVDLIRNDLSQISEQVEVTRFRYIDEINTSKGKLLQVSSEIRGLLPEDWKSQLGDLLFHMLPAGSISGAPKPKTLEIIHRNENYIRGFYTGVCGLFDGDSLDTGVMIRFIENTPEGFVYKSGGGITSFSDLDKEYQEYLDKIYVPVY